MEFFREDLHVFLVHFEDHAFFSIVITSGAYVIAAAIWQKSGRCSVIHPVLVATLLVVALLLATGMSYRVYFRQAYLLNETLGVVVVLLAVPLYRQFPLIRASGLSIVIALLAGSLVALASALAVPAATGSASSILATLAPKSATAAVAVEIADRLGGTFDSGRGHLDRDLRRRVRSSDSKGCTDSGRSRGRFCSGRGFPRNWYGQGLPDFRDRRRFLDPRHDLECDHNDRPRTCRGSDCCGIRPRLRTLLLWRTGVPNAGRDVFHGAQRRGLMAPDHLDGRGHPHLCQHLSLWLDRTGPASCYGHSTDLVLPKERLAAIMGRWSQVGRQMDSGRSGDAKTAVAVFDDFRRSGRIVRRIAGSVLLLGAAGCASAPAPPAPGAAGPYFALQPEAFAGEVVGSGECVDFVKVVAGAPRTAAWREGVEVRGNPSIPPGTAIATFGADGTYTNQSGNHAAIYLHQDEHGIWVYDQWRGQPVQKRLIRFEGGSGSQNGSKSNDGTRFAVIG